MKKIQRQAIVTTPHELINLAKCFIEDLEELMDNEKALNQKILVTIINKEGKSDTWRFE